MKKLKERGADVLLEGLKVDLSPGEDAEEACRTLGRNFAAFLNTSKV